VSLREAFQSITAPGMPFMTTTRAGEIWLAQVEFADGTRQNLAPCWFFSQSIRIRCSRSLPLQFHELHEMSP
jgi:hypothetical protein